MNDIKKEYLAVLDEQGNLTGEYVNRTIAHRDGILHGASHTYIYRIENGRIHILLQRRSNNKDSFPGSWDISSAGHMEYGMNFDATAQKELKEELGIDIDVNEINEVFTQRISKTNEFNGSVFNDQEINKIYILNKELNIFDLKLQEEEISKVKWFEVDEIINRLNSNDGELCLDEEEFLKVLDIIKEREYMEEKDLTKELYENVIINGRILHSPVITELGTQTDKYGESRLFGTMLKSEAAASLASKVPSLDPEVSSAIAVGIALGNPQFDELGEEFLKSKIPNYTKSGLGVALVKLMLQGLSGQRIDNIINGVENALEGRVPLSGEEKAAKLVNDIYDNSRKLSQYAREYNTYFLTNALKSTKEKGEITFEETDEWNNIKNMQSDRDIIKRNPRRLSELEVAYNYYLSDITRIPEKSRMALEGYDEMSIVAYYVISKGEDSIKKILNVAKEERDR